jgi:hypothetical protein
MDEPVVVAEVGGAVDEVWLTLGVYGEDLDPAEVSALLRCEPTGAHRRGDRRRLSPPSKTGAWLLRVEGSAPVEPDDLVARLLDRLPGDPAFWAGLTSRYTVQLSFALFVAAWSRGFDLSARSVQRVAALGLTLGFSIYAEADADQPGPSDLVG